MPKNIVLIHYHRRRADYTGWGLHLWGDDIDPTDWERPLSPSGQDAYGIYWRLELPASVKTLNFLIHRGNEKDPPGDLQLALNQKRQQRRRARDRKKGVHEVWLVQGRTVTFAAPDLALAEMEIRLCPAPLPGKNQVLLHYRRILEDYDGWGLHIWGDVTQPTDWAQPLAAIGQDAYGLYWVIDLLDGGRELNFIIHKGDEKDPGPDQRLNLPVPGNEIYLIQGTGQKFSDPQAACEMLSELAVGDIYQKAQAHWLKRNWIAWPIGCGPQAIYQLHFDPQANLKVTQQGIQGGERARLKWVSEQLPGELAMKFPHLSHAALLEVPDELLPRLPDILKSQIVVSATPPGGLPAATAIQLPGVLDDLYANAACRLPLGISWRGDAPELRVWAPTARSVRLRLYDSPRPTDQGYLIPMEWEAASGSWSVIGQPSWKNCYYCFEVEVYVRQAGQFVCNLVTDPYSLSLAMNSSRSQIVDLNDAALKPPGWDEHTPPPLEAFTDIVIYEFHLRDFSARDETVPPDHRGTYLAFTHLESNGMRHLRRLAQAGLTHVHLLPVFDFASVNDDKSTWQQVDFEALEQLPPDSDRQQAAVQSIRSRDAYNWGYDPWHFSTPEGSYATDPQGYVRIIQFRQMVQALHQIGLRVVMDVVYNHTMTAGQDERSVLDRIVPGYYYRLDQDGFVASSTCCANTASEHAMMEKLMLDSLRLWAEAYKIDGFRFDLMGHHMVSNLQNVRAMLDSLKGVEGEKIYLYGEGWDFGETARNARGKNASQFNLAGSGIGTFNDRLRDAARGGTPFRSPREQGFINGLYTDPNGEPDGAQYRKLLAYSDVIRLSLAGNLAEYSLINQDGLWLAGWQLDYQGAPCGYTRLPCESVNYVSAHDNETLFDSIQYKAPATANLDERLRMHNLGVDLVMFSQGVPFFDAGIELLRSKSLDRDSFDSGDWFNAIDYTYATNNWGKGLPLFDINGARWELMKTLLGNPALKPSSRHIQLALAHFEEMLRVRKSSRLFRLNSSDEIIQRLRFYNTGPWQMPGVIVMGIWDIPLDEEDKPWEDLDPQCEVIMVVFNARKEEVSFQLDELPNHFDFSLHPIQQNSADERVRGASYLCQTFCVPGRTTAIFVGHES